MKQSKSNGNRQKRNKQHKNKKSKFNLIEWFKEDPGFALICIGIAAFIIIITVVPFLDAKKMNARRVSVDSYSLEEMNLLLSTADEVQYACYSDYWDQPFTVIVDGKGLGTLTIPIFEPVKITNQAEEVLCTQEEIEEEFQDVTGLTYALKNQGKTTGYLVENSRNGVLFDTEKNLVAGFHAPDWKEDKKGMNLTDPEGNIIARLDCDLSLHTITFTYLTEEYRLTPEQQMSMLDYYIACRHGKYPEEFTKYANDYPLYNLFD